MPELRRMAQEANIIGQEAQEQTSEWGRNFNSAAEVASTLRAAHSVKSIKAFRPLLPR